MSTPPPLKRVVRRLLEEAGIPGDYTVDDEGSAVVVYYLDAPQPMPRRGPDGRYRMVPESRLENCHRVLARDHFLQVEPIEWLGLPALRVTDKLGTFTYT